MFVCAWLVTSISASCWKRSQDFSCRYTSRVLREISRRDRPPYGVEKPNRNHRETKPDLINSVKLVYSFSKLTPRVPPDPQPAPALTLPIPIPIHCSRVSDCSSLNRADRPSDLNQAWTQFNAHDHLPHDYTLQDGPWVIAYMCRNDHPLHPHGAWGVYTVDTYHFNSSVRLAAMKKI